MSDKKRGLLFQTKKQMNNGAIATGLGFVLYLVLLSTLLYLTNKRIWAGVKGKKQHA